ncbi:MULTISPECIES: hypothetical protein [Corynebacterium]|nr:MULTISPECIES: hypothetical protein [Corynebacterium]
MGHLVAIYATTARDLGEYDHHRQELEDCPDQSAICTRPRRTCIHPVA